jgi:hypothetical protein
VLSATSLLMHCSHLHSVDILLVCMRVSASARLVTFFIIILCGGTYACVPASTYCERDLLLSPYEERFLSLQLDYLVPCSSQ